MLKTAAVRAECFKYQQAVLRVSRACVQKVANQSNRFSFSRLASLQMPVCPFSAGQSERVLQPYAANRTAISRWIVCAAPEISHSVPNILPNVRKLHQVGSSLMLGVGLSPFQDDS